MSYAHGFGHIALADIAQRASVSLGNIYYYFKTKAALGEAIIAQRCAEFETMRARWDLEPAPHDRLKAFIRMTVDNRENLARAGCPVGSLCAELGKQRDEHEERAGASPADGMERYAVRPGAQLQLPGQHASERGVPGWGKYDA